MTLLVKAVNCSVLHTIKILCCWCLKNLITEFCLWVNFYPREHKIDLQKQKHQFSLKRGGLGVHEENN